MSPATVVALVLNVVQMWGSVVQMVSTANLAKMYSSSIDAGDVADAPTLALTTRQPSSDSLASSSADRSPQRVGDSSTSSPSVPPSATPNTPSATSASRAINIGKAAVSSSPTPGGGFTRNLSVNGLQTASISSSYGQSMLEGGSAMHDFHFNMGPKAQEAAEAAEAAEMLHVSSPGKYVQTLQAVGLELIDFRDLSEHLSVFYDAMVDEVCSATPRVTPTTLPTFKFVCRAWGRQNVTLLCGEVCTRGKVPVFACSWCQMRRN